MSDTPRTDRARDYRADVLARNARLIDLAEVLERELTAAQKDAERLEWLEQKLFMSAWNGVLDSGSNRDWRIHSGYRHVTARMQGGTFRNAIDAAIAAEKQPPPA